jgi:protein-tyrosine kinase
MSLLENALKKLHGRAVEERAANPAPRPTAPRPPAQPQTRKKKIAMEGPKHHVDLQHLVEAGLMVDGRQAAIVADEFRKIKRPLIANFLNGDVSTGTHSNVIMIASALPNAGKTFCAMNLAMSLSVERDLNVLLVDADVAKPHISRELGLADAPGLIDLLMDDAKDLNELLVRTDLNDIQLLPAGQPHPQATELLASDRMSAIVAELATRYPDRLVVMDSPPLLITSEAQALANHVGQITLVVEAGKTSHQELSRVLETLNTSKAINIILNKSRDWTGFADYSGNYGYPYRAAE